MKIKLVFRVLMIGMLMLFVVAPAKATILTFETWTLNNRGLEYLNTQKDGTGNTFGSRINTVGPIAYEETTGTYTHNVSFAESNGWTPNIVLTWTGVHFDSYLWIDSAGNRGNVVQLDNTSPAIPADLLFTPDADWAVLINSFDLDEHNGTPNGDTVINWEIFDDTGILASGTWDEKNNANDPLNQGGRTTIYTGLTAGDVNVGNAVTLRFMQTSGDKTYTAVDNINFDQVVPELRIEKDKQTLTVNEQGPTSDSYGIKLSREPNQPTVMVTASRLDAQITVNGGASVTLTFTNANWDTFQTVTVAAVDDDLLEEDHTSKVVYTLVSNDSFFNNAGVTPMTVYIIDNDVPGIVDWPTHLHDNQRSGTTTEQLPLPLQQEWVYNLSHGLHPAGPETPALQNFYGNTHGHKSRMPIDNAFRVVVVGESLYFGAANGDKLICLNTRDGSERWKFFANGPIRFTPTAYNNKVYFGSDDGYVYCLNGSDGSMVWSKRATSSNGLMFVDGRMVSVCPVRTSVLVDNGVAYWGAGLFNGAKTGLTRYLCACNAENGTDIWTVTPPRPLQGYPMVSADRLYVPAGKAQPTYYRRADGYCLGAIGNSRQGGTYALLTNDNKLFFGPHYSSNGSYIGKYDANTGNSESVAWGPGNYLVVTADYAYYSSDTSLYKINRSTQNTVWQITNSYPYELIMAGGTLFAGGDDEVAALSTQDGSLLWKASVNGRVRSLAVADGSLYVSTDQGTVHCFKPWFTNVNLIDYCILAMDWLDAVVGGGDYTNDGIVDFSDLSMLRNYWLAHVRSDMGG